MATSIGLLSDDVTVPTADCASVEEIGDSIWSLILVRQLLFSSKTQFTEIEMHMYFILYALSILLNIHIAHKSQKFVVTTNLKLCNTLMAQLRRLSAVSFNAERR